MTWKSCSDCRHYFEVVKATDDHPGAGQCRVRAPTVGFVKVTRAQNEAALVEQPERCTSFPSVDGDVWCGEFETK